MLGKINATNEVYAIDEKIAIEYEDIEHIVDLKFTRRQIVTFSSICAKYDQGVVEITYGESERTIEDLDKEFIDNVGNLIDLSFIKGKDSVNKKVNTIRQINAELEKIKP